MNLKYYLKGLGLGIIVTALILGIHHKVSDKTMTDAEVKLRAQELGMVDSNSKLVSGNDELSAQDLLETINETEEPEAAVSSSNDDTTDSLEENEQGNSDEMALTENDDEVNSEEEKEIELENTRIDSVTDAEDDPDRKSDGALAEETEIEEDVDTSAENNDEEADDSQTEASTATDETVSVTGGIVLTINSGDSSDRVARKLAELGLVLDASDYDTFLCSYGYDRLIRVGTYTIPEGASNDEIAKIITGKR